MWSQSHLQVGCAGDSLYNRFSLPAFLPWSLPPLLQGPGLAKSSQSSCFSSPTTELVSIHYHDVIVKFINHWLLLCVVGTQHTYGGPFGQLCGVGFLLPPLRGSDSSWQTVWQAPAKRSHQPETIHLIAPSWYQPAYRRLCKQTTQMRSQ